MNRIITKIQAYKLYWPLAVALCCLLLSFAELSSNNQRARRLERVERVLHRKQRKVENLALQALNAPSAEWLSPHKVKEDMVLYKYVKDSLVSWVNTFPIINDSYTPDAVFPNLSFFARNRLQEKPLAQANEFEQYLNLGSAWYVVRVYTKGDVSILTGILIKTDFPFSNNFVSSKANKSLHLPSYCSIVPLNRDEGFVIFGKEDGILFTILSDVSLQKYPPSIILRWLALFFTLLFFVLRLIQHRSTSRAFYLLAALAGARIVCFVFAPALKMSTMFFSPLLYAGGALESSLASLVFSTLLITLGCWAIYYVRHDTAHLYMHFKPLWRHLTVWFQVIIGVGLILFIHHAIKSLALNSSIVLELFKLDEIDGYTILAYATFSLLFLSLYLMLRTMLVVQNIPRSRFIMQPKFIYVFLLVAACYTLMGVSLYGRQKEILRYQVWIQKMAVERDLDLEIQIRRVEKMIAMDPILSIMIQMEQNTDVILERIQENYFSDFLQRYQIQVTVCAPGDVLMVDGVPNPVPCYNFFHSELLRYGSPLSEDSQFYHRTNSLGNISYLGVFTYYNYGGSLDLYIEIDARYVKDALGYPSLLSDKSQLDKFKLPYNYSYAKYVDNKLTSSSGQYTYTSILSIPLEEGFSSRTDNGQLHYFYQSGNRAVVISRPTRSPFPYLVAFSYIFLFYGALFSLYLGTFRRKQFRMNLPKHSFRRKITWLLVGSLVVALIFMATGSLGFGLSLYERSNERQMEDQMQTAKAFLEEYIRKADHSNDPVSNMVELLSTLNRLSTNVQIQVHLYDPEGRLMRSSQPEIFEQHLMSTRMDGLAFSTLKQRETPQYTHKEHIGTLQYYAMYAPLYNTRGELAAYINVPYLSGQTDVTKETTTIAAAVINLYLILLLVAIILSFTVSNQLTRPLAELSENMSRLDVTQKAEPINYSGDNELGTLVKAYNKMVEDLDESTRALAQSEREQAWREMARQIAHEIKNPLTPMRLSIQHLVRLKNEGSPKWTQRFDSVADSLLEQIDILAEAASEFSNFSRFYMEDPTEVELNALIKEHIVLFNTSDHIHIHFNSSVKEAVVMGRRSQLARLLVNLLSNAVQALEDLYIGVITITLTLDGDYYLLQIADNGPGVAPENRDKLFKPNFTTKSSGTGLGLTICRGILEQSQGEIYYTPSEWGGACFNVRIPAAGLSK